MKRSVTYADQMPRKEVAWNGIQFQVPARWEVGRLGTHYLMIEDESEPVLEVKWGHVRGTFSHKTHLRRLAALHGKLPGKTLRECPLPTGWKKALGRYEATGFSWRGKSLGGKGVVLYCPRCKNAALIQFYYTASGGSEDITLSVLASFRDHRQDDQTVWSIFDIRAVMPEELQLVRYRLEPGQFELVFKSRNKKVTLHRWGPATILLQNRELFEFSRNLPCFPKDAPQFVIEADGKTLTWEVSPSRSGWFALLVRVKETYPFQRFRLWHLEKENRILGVKAEGKTSIEARLFDGICNAYEIV